MNTDGAPKHENWSSRVAFLLAAIGAAVGLGNIWKFPYTLGQSGGAAFVTIYLVAIFLVATPIMLSEMVIGRRGRMSAPNSLLAIARSAGASPRWSWLGWLGIVAVMLVLSFFSVVAGWSIAYLVATASGTFTGMSAAETGRVFDQFLHDPMQLVVWHFMFMALTVYVVAKGINAGIERWVKLLMPALFVMLLGLVVYGAVAGDFAQAVTYLFAPDFSALTPEIALAAVGQAFFSVNVGIGAVLVYSAYLPADVNLPKSALIIALGDTAVALLAGLAIFPIVFAYGLDPAEGAGLIFVTLSTAFGQMPGGRFIGAVFFLLVFVAALTSSISMLEVMTSRAEETPGRSRKLMAPVLGAVAFVIGLATVFSFNYWEDVRLASWLPSLADKTIFQLIDYLVTNIMLPLGGMLYALFAGWWMSKESTMSELGMEPGAAYTLWLVLVRFVAPLAVAAVFLSNLT